MKHLELMVKKLESKLLKFEQQEILFILNCESVIKELSMSNFSSLRRKSA